MSDTPSVLLLPGWLDSGPGHWQTRWEALHGHRRVVQHDWEWPRRGDWMARLEEVVRDSECMLMLVAHSLGCHLAAAWAAHSSLRHRVAAALLVAPPDLERAELPPQIVNWRPAVATPLPFPGLLAYSEDDPFASAEASVRLAGRWAVPAWNLGARGHLNADSGLGDWPEALQRLHALLGAEGAGGSGRS